MMNLPPYLDHTTSALVADLVDTLARHHANLLTAVILYGSVARHEERPLDHEFPSDVDLLAIFDTEDSLILPYRDAIIHSLGNTYRKHRDAPREVNVMFGTRTLQEWDGLFLANVARDGVILYTKGLLPEPLQALQRRLAVSSG